MLRYYIAQFSPLIEVIKLSDKYNDSKEIFQKIAINLKKEEIAKDKVIFYNGQIGKTFYIILEGEVSILIPCEYTVKISIEKYYEYLQHLYKFREYELLRLSFESNKNIVDNIDYQFGDIIKSFDYCLDKTLPFNCELEEISAESYIERFSLFKEKRKENEKSNKKIKNKLFNAELDSEIKNNDSENKNNDSENKINDSENKNNDSDNENIKLENTKNNNEKSNLSNFSINFQNKIKINIKHKNKLRKYKKKYNFTLWEYVEVTKLGEGKCFGEIALQREKNKRTATIITLTDCLFGILQKDEYQQFMKKMMENARRNNIERLLNTKLFYGITYTSFDARLFNYFIFSKEKKGNYFFKQGEKRTQLLYIKKGEIQLEITATCKQLDNIILLIGGNPFNNSLNNLIKDNQRIKEYINIPKKFNISIFSKGDIIGTDELVHLNYNSINSENISAMEPIDNNSFFNNLQENTFLFNAKYLTNSDVFKLDMNFLKNMLKDSTIKNNYNKMLKDKKERLIERLLNIKTNTILQYFNLISDSKTITNNINDLNEKKKFIYFRNNKKIINNNHIIWPKNLNSIDYQNSRINKNRMNHINNLINSRLNTKCNFVSNDISKIKCKSKTKEFFYQEQNNKLNNDSLEIKERALLTSYMNNNKFKMKLAKKLLSNKNNSLHKTQSEGKIKLNKEKLNGNYSNNIDLNKFSGIKTNLKFRNIFSNLNNNKIVKTCEGNMSKNNSNEKISNNKSYKTFFPMKKSKKININNIAFNSFKNTELKFINYKKIPKLLMNNALIYNTVIDKIIQSKKILIPPPLLTNHKENETIDINFRDNETNSTKTFNHLDVLAFDNILNEIKNNKIKNKKGKHFSPNFQISKLKNKFNNNPLPRTGSYFFMKRNNKF